MHYCCCSVFSYLCFFVLLWIFCLFFLLLIENLTSGTDSRPHTCHTQDSTPARRASLYMVANMRAVLFAVNSAAAAVAAGSAMLLNQAIQENLPFVFEKASISVDSIASVSENVNLYSDLVLSQFVAGQYPYYDVHNHFRLSVWYCPRRPWARFEHQRIAGDLRRTGTAHR